MAARKKKTKGNTLELVKLHIDTQTRLADLAGEVQALRRAGKIREAKRLKAHIREIRGNLQALERRDSVRAHRTTRSSRPTTSHGSSSAMR